MLVTICHHYKLYESITFLTELHKSKQLLLVLKDIYAHMVRNSAEETYLVVKHA